MDDFEFVVDIQVRLRDVDEMGHVNNTVCLSYLETARDAYAREVVGESLIELGAVLVNLEVDYQAAIQQTDDVAVGVRVCEIGTTSMRIAYELRANGETAATAETALVAYDRETDESKPIPEHWRSAIESYEGL